MLTRSLITSISATVVLTLWHPNILFAENKTEALKGKSLKQPVTVLQKRFFLKAYRPEIGMLLGSFLNEAYTDTKFAGFRTSLFLNEWFGAEVQYLKTSIRQTDDRKALNELKYRDLNEEKVVSPDPETNPIQNVTDFAAIAAPFYGKLNLFNKYIVYSDLYVSAGLSNVETDQGRLNAWSTGLGQRFYMMKSMSIRLDYKLRSFVERRNNKASRRNAQSIDLGFSYFFF